MRVSDDVLMVRIVTGFIVTMMVLNIRYGFSFNLRDFMVSRVEVVNRVGFVDYKVYIYYLYFYIFNVLIYWYYLLRIKFKK